MGTDGNDGEIQSGKNMVYYECDEMQSHNQSDKYSDQFLVFHTADGWSADGTRPYNPPFRGRVFWILLHLFYMGNMRIHENGQREGRI